MSETEQEKKIASAFQYAEYLVKDLHPGDLAEVEVAVVPDDAGGVSVSIRAEVKKSQSAANVLRSTYDYMRHRHMLADQRDRIREV